MFTSKKSNKRVSSRHQIDIKSVRDGVLQLGKLSYRCVLSISSINFELKSEAEQDAIIDTYQSFLNSLASPIQIIVRVREMDMDKYLHEFKTKMASEKSKIYKQQIENYTEFVGGLISKNKILSRQFYVVVPHESDEKDFEIIREQLDINLDIVSKGLSRLGMHARKLDSIELLDLFYSFYSPKQAKRQPLKQQTMQMLTEGYL